MTINYMDISCDRRSSNLRPSKFLKQKLNRPDFATEGSICSLSMKHGKYDENVEYKSPYLSGDSVHLLSQITEKRRVFKKAANIVSTLPIANIYKANSDEFQKSKQNKKTHKSVLTIPNEHAPVPQLCTVSDMNDSEYFNRNDENRKKTKRRSQAAHTKKYRIDGKVFKFYDRDAREKNVKLDRSSTDMLKALDTDNISKSEIGSSSHVDGKAKPHDVWAVLRNFNRFQLSPSPPISEESFISPTKKKGHKKHDNKKDMRVFERCTEEFAYISSYEVDRQSRCSFSSQGSMDTVIEKKNSLNKINKRIEKKQTIGRMDGKLSKPLIYKRNIAKNKNLPEKLQNNKKTNFANQKNKKCDNGYGDSSLLMCSSNEDKTLVERKTLHQGVKNITFSNINANDTPQSSQHGELIYSGTSESGTIKGNKRIAKTDRRGTKKYQEESNQPVNGITKVVVSNNQNDLPFNRITSTKRKPLQTATILNNQRNFTSTEIKRLLNKQKFPVVILGKNQLSSTIEVLNEEPPQFKGLSEHIWPFMLNWYGKRNNNVPYALETNLSETNGQTINKHVDVAKNIESKIKNKSRQSRLNDKKSNNELQCNKIKIGRNVPVKLADIFNKSRGEEKSKPIRQFRDRMLKLLYKNSSALSVIDSCSTCPVNKNSNNNIDKSKVDNSTNTGFDADEKNSRKTTSFTSPKTYSYKRPWAKTKWASEFIDNVIRKVKNGAYYTNDSKVTNQIIDHVPKEVNVQTIPTCDVHNEKSLTIPGFDNVQPAVEIKTMNTNEISVKHCVTNIMVHFDVTVPTEPVANLKQSSSLIPVNGADSHTKCFKCKTSILNAMLPAELCSLLPKMLHNITELREQFPYVAIPIEKPLYLSTISEMSQCESPKDSHKSPFLQKAMSQELWRLLIRGFMNTDNMYPKLHIVQNSSLLIKYERQLSQEFMPDINRPSLLHFHIIINPIMPLSVNIQKSEVMPSNKFNKLNTYTASKLCPVSEHRLNPSFKRSELSHSFNNTLSPAKYNGALCLSVKTSNYGNVITVSMAARHLPNLLNMLTLVNGSFKMDFPFNGCLNGFVNNNIITFFTNPINKTPNELNKCIDYVDISSSNNEKKDRPQTYVFKSKKIRRNSYVRLYKKCKSTSIIYGEKVTPLSKIANVDDFFQALGSGKLLSTVFDSQSRQKIMSSIQEMKNWTTEINPRQALLILLLTNKKDTSNLLRYRQVLLQGIAVNRITKSDELDMEIEVIERENLNRLSQYEGISYLPASTANQDNLFEELCWIAKTTASDYQRPFEESSIKLLKSLLEKRKQLNPSYLRVMARYVGLGLLKSPGKK